ncbi:MAG: DUF308 domain-containing protein [Acidobacteriota bacterium]|jgi:uncharacterized membrane protein HdeD (DUF308 family)
MMSLVKAIQHEAKTAKWVGIFLLISGFLALIAPLATGLSITILVGVLFIFSGALQLALVFRSESFGQGLLLALLALLSLVAGVYMVFQPVAALATLTLFLAGYFVASGAIEALSAFGAKPMSGWGWLLFNGIVSIVLGVLIWRQFPLSGAWAIGTLVGVRMIMSGWTLITVGGLAKDAATQ